MARIAIAGSSDLVTLAGEIVAGEGGSVVDVACAAGLAAMCTDPGVCAPGAGGYLTIAIEGVDPVVIDGYMAFPGIGFTGRSHTREVTMEYGGGVTTLVDAGSVAVPGAFAALALAVDRYGTVPWRLILDTVADIVDAGFPMSRPASTYLSEGAAEIFDQDPASLAALFPGGRRAEEGEMIHFENLGSTLRLIGESGPDILYQGDLGKSIADDLASRGSRLTRNDLQAYSAVARHPLSIDLAGWRLNTNPAPAVGGIALSLALADISRSSQPLSPATWYTALETAFRTRADRLEPSRDRDRAAHAVLEAAGLLSPSTVSVAAAEAGRGAVAASFSAGYGSGVVPAGTGMLMNNSVGEIELLAGGLEAQRPGDRMLSNMAPSVAVGERRVLALSSPGADRITSALAITLARAIHGRDGLAQAIDHPRVHPERVAGGWRAATEDQIALPGIDVEVRSYPGHHMYFGGVTGAEIGPEDVSAYADPRRVGSVALID